MDRDILFVAGSLLAYVIGVLILLFVSVLIYVVIDKLTGDALGYIERLMGGPEEERE